MAMFQLGMNPAAVRQVATSLGEAERTLLEVGGSLDRTMGQLRQTWGGTDASAFQSRWTQDRAKVREAAAALRQMAQTLDRNVEAQDKSSQADGGGVPTAPGGEGAPQASPDAFIPGIGPATPNLPQPVPKFTEQPKLNPDVDRMWQIYLASNRDVPDAREQFVHKLAQDMAEQWGVPMPIIEVRDPGGGWGGLSSSDPPRIVIHPRMLDDPSLMVQVVAHEMRHQYQDQAIRALNPFAKVGPLNDPPTRAQALEWSIDKRLPVKGAGIAYLNQPVETDARKAALEYVESFTTDDFMRVAGRP